jgi:menaquinone-dependent protoporphyrinogen IX oxidase
VYYSRSGTTQKVGKAIAKALTCDIEEIIAPSNRNGFFGYWRSATEARRHTPAEILPAKQNPSAYDLVVIGTPIWAWSVSSPVRAYLLANRGLFADVAFFCTMAETGGTRTFWQMQLLTGKVPRAVMAVTKREAAADAYINRIATFIDAVRSAHWRAVRVG